MIPVPEELTPRGPAVVTPPRRAGSVRRTSSIDMHWPDGIGTQLRLVGRGRDLLTPADGGAPQVLTEVSLEVGVNSDTRVIEEIRSDPPRAALHGLVGARGGGNSRGLLAELLPEEAIAGTPLYLLLDEVSGASLIAGFALSRWFPRQRLLELRPGPARVMEGVCTGFMPGSGALLPDGGAVWDRHVDPVGPVESEDDPWGWHEIPVVDAMSMRRARRIDVNVDDLIRVDSMFQDSATEPDGGRVAVHEYCLSATADPETGRLITIDADPRVLPYRECRLAAPGLDALLDVPLTKLRGVVLERLSGSAGCTHLNDAVRALAEVPVLASRLTAAS